MKDNRRLAKQLLSAAREIIAMGAMRQKFGGPSYKEMDYRDFFENYTKYRNKYQKDFPEFFAPYDEYYKEIRRLQDHRYTLDKTIENKYFKQALEKKLVDTIEDNIENFDFMGLRLFRDLLDTDFSDKNPKQEDVDKFKNTLVYYGNVNWADYFHLRKLSEFEQNEATVAREYGKHDKEMSFAEHQIGAQAMLSESSSKMTQRNVYPAVLMNAALIAFERKIASEKEKTIIRTKAILPATAYMSSRNVVKGSPFVALLGKIFTKGDSKSHKNIPEIEAGALDIRHAQGLAYYLTHMVDLTIEAEIRFVKSGKVSFDDAIKRYKQKDTHVVLFDKEIGSYVYSSPDRIERGDIKPDVYQALGDTEVFEKLYDELVPYQKLRTYMRSDNAVAEFKKKTRRRDTKTEASHIPEVLYIAGPQQVANFADIAYANGVTYKDLLELSDRIGEVAEDIKALRGDPSVNEEDIKEQVELHENLQNYFDKVAVYVRELHNHPKTIEIYEKLGYALPTEDEFVYGIIGDDVKELYLNAYDFGEAQRRRELAERQGVPIESSRRRKVRLAQEKANKPGVPDSFFTPYDQTFIQVSYKVASGSGSPHTFSLTAPIPPVVGVLFSNLDEESKRDILTLGGTKANGYERIAAGASNLLYVVANGLAKELYEKELVRFWDGSLNPMLQKKHIEVMEHIINLNKQGLIESTNPGGTPKSVDTDILGGRKGIFDQAEYRKLIRDLEEAKKSAEEDRKNAEQAAKEAKEKEEAKELDEYSDYRDYFNELGI